MLRVHFFDTMTSTNSVLAEVARAGAPTGTVMVAKLQSAGRGQGDRGWASPEGGLWMSTLVRGPIDVSVAGWLPLTAGVAIAEVLATAGVHARLKWPNDVLVGDKKAAGVLVESGVAGARVEWAVIGTGVNVHNPPPLPTSTNLASAGYADDVRTLALALAPRILEWAATLTSRGAAPVREAFLKHDMTLHRRVRTPEVDGTAVDVGPGGELVVETGKGRVSVRSGPLEFV